MYSPKINQIAHTLVNYSTRLQPGELVAIMGAPVAEPLLAGIYRHALRAGAHPQVFTTLPITNEILLREGNDQQIQFVSPLLEMVINEFDCRIVILSEENTKALTNIDPARQVLQARAMQRLTERDLQRLGDPQDSYRWTGALFPTNAYAQDAEMSLSEYTDFVFDACLPHFDVLPADAKAFAQPDADHEDPITYWEAFSRWQGQIVSHLNKRRELYVVGPHIDLRLGIEGRKWWNADGHVNFPDGEVFTGPIEDAVDGWVSFSYPAVFRGNEVRDVHLRFEHGRVVEATASHGQDFLYSLLDTDEGARRVGEFAIGTNPNITRFTRNTLFDEKIRGTCHLALGASIPGTGGVNESAIHWDMVCDLRQDSRVFADGELFYENGEFAVKFAPQVADEFRGMGTGSMAAMFGRQP